MSDFQVDITALQTLRDRCAQLAALFDGDVHDDWKRQVGLAGTPALVDALAGFESHWGDGRKKVKGHLTNLVDRTQAAIDQYSKTDGDLATNITESGGPP